MENLKCFSTSATHSNVKIIYSTRSGRLLFIRNIEPIVAETVEVNYQEMFRNLVRYGENDRK